MPRACLSAGRALPAPNGDGPLSVSGSPEPVSCWRGMNIAPGRAGNTVGNTGAPGCGRAPRPASRFRKIRGDLTGSAAPRPSVTVALTAVFVSLDVPVAAGVRVEPAR
ncbi:hypothetical protein FrCorBMG51_02740 [Protofrankia coriariae]|uniref:Uncharacterized protein n=1 Tax=Protofrankia coriariae TaxID=1562887 RepID=A0ABR5F7B5_9ACTN|nr:hypothetical protein FrCorBMG51_02740 [Protofrankia coriariae]